MRSRLIAARLVLCLFFVYVFFLCYRPVIFAQQESPTAIPSINLIASPNEFDFEKAYRDYVQVYNSYVQAHKEYLLAKNQYEAYKTLTAKTIALEQTIRMLQSRDEVIAAFLITLRAKLAEETNIASSKLNVLYLLLDEEITWYRQHRETLTSAGTIPDLIKISNLAQSRYNRTESYIYQSLLEMFLYKEDIFQDLVARQIEVIDDKIIEIRNRADKDTSTIERWLLEAKNRKSRSEEKFSELKSYTITEKLKSSEKNHSFNGSVYVIEQGHQYLKETLGALIEIVKEIKRGD
ncbi:MAG TPA: hypothetical protein VMW41_03905 [Candidatus Bathyarchaeia archaeon]|nr:hypothetical protein [Candidatus Bathyarchaeia archaeon]